MTAPTGPESTPLAGEYESVLRAEAEVEASSRYASGYSTAYSHGFTSGVDWLLDALGLEQVGWYNVFVGPNGNPGDRVEVGVQSFHPTEAGWESEPVYRLAASGRKDSDRG